MNKYSKIKDFAFDYKILFFENGNPQMDTGLTHSTYALISELKEKLNIEPLLFINVLYWNLLFILENRSNPSKVISHLQQLPFENKYQLHTLYGFILKWFGGYPI